MASDPCQCLKLQRVVTNSVTFYGLRCPHCVDSIMEAKNALVRRVNELESMVESLRPRPQQKL